jgi:hypothetical protein
MANTKKTTKAVTTKKPVKKTKAPKAATPSTEASDAPAKASACYPPGVL